MKTRICLLFLCILTTPLCTAQKLDTVFLSPTGRFSVTFKQLKHTIFEHPQNIGESSNIKYQITFTDKLVGNSRNFDYIDVYVGVGDSQPSPLGTIFQMIDWSPSENFAVLPEEEWARAPGAPQRIAVNLDSNHRWSSSLFCIDKLVWLDSVTVVGDAYDDCDYGVLLFDGVTGRTDTIKQGQSPLGYELHGIKGDSLLIETVLDNCQSDEDRESFSPRTISLNIGDIFKKLPRSVR